MSVSRYSSLTALVCLSITLVSCSGESPPKPGRELSLPDYGVTIRLADGWVAKVESTDWATWQRVKKGRATDPWVFPPVTATNVGAGIMGPDDRYMTWRFKGVKGTFDPAVNPLTSGYPQPPGLWTLNSMKLELLETETRTLKWTGMSGIDATCRLYENTHGTGATSAIWHTYTVVFNCGPNACEFVMSIPDFADYRDWMDQFWASIEDVTIKPT